jgi:hypothetical protein
MTMNGKYGIALDVEVIKIQNINNVYERMSKSDVKSLIPPLSLSLLWTCIRNKHDKFRALVWRRLKTDKM